MFQNIINTNTPECMEKIVFDTLSSNIKVIEQIGIEVRWSCYDSRPEY